MGSATIVFFSICGRGLDGVDLLVLFAVIFLFLGSESDGDFAVEGGKLGFELLQLVLLAPCLATMASSWGTSALSLAVRSSYCSMMPGIFSRALTKFMQAA